MKNIGPTFAAELDAARLTGLPFSWGDDGVIQFGPSMTKDQKDAVSVVYEAHDPFARPMVDTRSEGRRFVEDVLDTDAIAALKARLAR